MKTLLLIISGSCLAVVLFFAAFHLFKKRSMQLMRAVYSDKNYDVYRQLVNTWICKLLLSKKQKLFFEMAVCEGEGREEDLLSTFERLKKQKLNTQETLDLYYNQLRYYIRKKDDEQIEATYLEAKEKFKDNQSGLVAGSMKEMLYLVEVDYRENTDYLKEIEKLAHDITIEHSKGIFCARACRLYLKKNNQKKADEYYSKAVCCLNRETVDELLKDCIKNKEAVTK